MGPLLDLVALHPLWIWLALGAALLTMELVTGSGWLLWPAAAAAAAVVGLLSAVTPLGPTGQATAFAVVTILATYLGRRCFFRGGGKRGHDINDPLARLIGHRGSATATFDAGRGRVFVDGKEWAAELEGAAPVGAGAPVEVVAVLGGARLKVRPG